MSTLMDVQDLKTYFKTDRGLVKAVDGVSYHVDEGETIGLVGESGCGKSASILSTMQLIPIPPGIIEGGKVMFEGRDLLSYGAKSAEMRSIRGGKISMIFQEPMTSLNPVLTISRQMTEMIELHLGMNSQASREKALELLRMVGISEPQKRIDGYPHQFSGGMRQRVMIAIALSCNPKLILADEPTTALDVTTQAQLLELMKDMSTQFKSSLVIVTHNMGVVARYVQRIYVMYAGRVIESGTTEDLFGNPQHPYTIGLLKCIPQLGETQSQKKLVPILGTPPNLIHMPSTCAFLPRCSYHTRQCQQEPWPQMRQAGINHQVACYVNIQEKG